MSARGEFGLEFGEVGSSVVDYHHLTIEDGLTEMSREAAMEENRFTQSCPFLVNAFFRLALVCSRTR